MLSDYTSQLIVYRLKMLFVAVVLLGRLLGVVIISAMIFKSNTTLKVENLLSKDGNLYHVYCGLDDDFASHQLYLKDLKTLKAITAFKI